MSKLTTKNTLTTEERSEQLKADHASKAYKSYGTFAQYCRRVYGISSGYAYKIISGYDRKKKNISASLRWDIWERDNFTCQYCHSRRFLAVDHVVPESQGGTTDPSNLVTACEKCNRSKGTDTVDAFKFKRVMRFSLGLFGRSFK